MAMILVKKAGSSRLIGSGEIVWDDTVGDFTDHT